MLEDYAKARKLGLKQVERDVAAGHYPYPPALDDILKNQGYQGEVPVGLTEIDLSLIAGTKTRGRQNMFSSGFLPIAEAGSEFAAKWSDLIDSQRTEGLRDPIVVYEYLQRFYVQEGNKRVSVSRYLGMPTILANITRVTPMPSDEKGLRVYHEFTRFYRVCPIYGITSAEEGFYARLAALLGQDLETHTRSRVDLRALFDAFSASFRARGGGDLDLQVGDALAYFVSIFGFEHVRALAPREVDEHVAKVWGEFVVKQGEGARAYLEDPSADHTAPLPKLKNLAKKAVLAKPFRVAFIYDRNPLSSGWISLHERGRARLEERLAGTVVTHAFTDRSSDAAFDQAVDEAIEHKADLIVSCAPTQMRQTLRAAAEHPGPAYLNCSVSLSHSAVRGFYGRMYEAKFLLGALAASLAGHHKVGYVAESPVFSTVAEINAFAIGAQMVDPYATVYLKWFSAKDYNWRRELREEGVHIISGRDYANPLAPQGVLGPLSGGGQRRRDAPRRARLEVGALLRDARPLHQKRHVEEGGREDPGAVAQLLVGHVRRRARRSALRRPAARTAHARGRAAPVGALRAGAPVYRRARRPGRRRGAGPGGGTAHERADRAHALAQRERGGAPARAARARPRRPRGGGGRGRDPRGPLDGAAQGHGALGGFA